MLQLILKMKLSLIFNVKEIRAASTRADNQAILDQINKTSATNMDCKQ